MSSRSVRLGAALAAVAILLTLLASAVAGCGGNSAQTAETSTQMTTDPGAASASKGEPVQVPGKLTVLPVAQRGNPILWVRKGHSAMLRASPGGEPVKRLRPRTEFGSPTVLSVDHVQGNWAAVPTALLRNGQLGWVKLDPKNLGSGFTGDAIHVDLSERVAELRRGHHLIDRFPVTVGAPGSETPIGRFSVTDTFRGDLDKAAYGCCALALTARQPHLPSGWIGGSRIAIHGTSGPLGEALSHGCVRARDEDVSLLVDKVSLGTPVTISP